MILSLVTMPHSASPYSAHPHPKFDMSPRHTLVTLLILSTIVLVIISLFTLHLESTFIIEWELLSINSRFIRFPIVIDPIGTFIAATVIFISFNVFIFSKTYMNNDPNLTRFSYLLLLFIGSIIALIFSPNLITLILGWDGLGVTRFLLVIYYPTSDSLNRGLVTALTNRIGDCFLLGAIALILSQGQWNSWSLWVPSINRPTCLALLVLLAAITKRAQLPFMYWLPEAIAAPTPVSTLVHSSTLVTAGVYMIIRFYPFISSINQLNNILLFRRGATLLGSRVWATVELDIKKIVALSTISQISLIILTLRLGLPSLAYLHLVTHAIFKSLLFLTVGTHIIITHHQQNLQNLEADIWMPSLAVPASVSLAALNAFFFTAGYYSKDLIVETSLYIPKTLIIEQLVLTAIGTRVGSTITYRIRLHRVLCNSTKLVYPDGLIAYRLYSVLYINDFNSSIRTPVMWLTIGSIIIGRIAIWAFLTPHETPTIYIEPHIAPWCWATLGFGMATSSCALNHKLKIVHSSPFKFKKFTIYKTEKLLKALLNRKKNNLHPKLKTKLDQLYNYFYKKKKHIERILKIANDPTDTQHYAYKHLTANKFDWDLDTAEPETGYRENCEMIGGIEQLTYFIVPYIINLSNKIYKIMDQGWLEFYLPHSTTTTISSLTSKLSKTERSFLTVLFFLLVMAFVILTLLLFSLLH